MTGFVKKWLLENQIVTKTFLKPTYLPTYLPYLCDRSDINGSSDSSDSRDNSDNSYSSDQKTVLVTKNVLKDLPNVFSNILMMKKTHNCDKIQNSNCDENQNTNCE